MTEALALECRRLEESCLFTSTTLFIWVRCLRGIKWTLLTLPVVLGSLATWNLLARSTQTQVQLIVAVSPFLASLMPGVLASLKIDDHIKTHAEAAGQYKILQHRFRHAANVLSLQPYADFKTDFTAIRDKYELIRIPTLTAPEWCFEMAREKIAAGHYTFGIDEKEPRETNPDLKASGTPGAT